MKAFYAVLLAALVVAGCGGGLEKKVVGSWKIDSAKSDLGTSKMKSDAEKKMAEAMASQMTLELKADKTFTLTFIMPLNGTWALTGSKVVLTPDKGAKASFGGKDTMDLDVDSSGSSMSFDSPDPAKPGKLVFVKS